MTEPLFDLEDVYDEEIAPLMTRIIDICKAHNMPMLASFMYGRDEGDDPKLCTTALLSGPFSARDIPSCLTNACDGIYSGRRVPMMRTTLTKADGTTETTITAFLDK